VYPPGSTFKPFMAAAALSTGLATTGGRYPCTSEYKYADRVFRNWKARNASISLAQSLIESCDTVYYNFGARWWGRERTAERAGKKVYEAQADWARKFGMGHPTKIDLPAESGGRIPDRAWRRAFWERNRGTYCRQFKRGGDAVSEDLCKRGYVWRPGDSINASIGQGDVQVSPLQLGVAYAALANGGRVMQPHVGRRIIGSDGKPARSIAPVVSGRVPLAGRPITYLHDSLAAVSERGTGVFPFRGWPFGRIRMASKTGSAEIAGKQPFSWFAAFAPAGAPRYAVVSVVEEAGFGSQVSGPIVRRIMDKLFDLPLTPIVYGTARSD
jgi:penicillin-binding protein 2